MNSDFKSSINKILNERLTSPFWGAFIFSWLVWNWEIVYVSFFISENRILGTKIDYIIYNCSQISHLLWYPICSTMGLVLIIPIITNGAYWISIRYDKWRVDQKNAVDKKVLLSVEQSIKIKDEIRHLEERYDRLLTKKDEEVNMLNLEVVELRSRNSVLDETIKRLEDTNRDLTTRAVELQEQIRKSNADQMVRFFNDQDKLMTTDIENGTTKDSRLDIRLKTPNDDIIKKMVESFGVEDIEKVLTEISYKNYISKSNPIVKRMINLDLLVMGSNDNDDAKFTFSNKGLSFKNDFFNYYVK